eukprot:TRINITY_DN56559_c0_g1_i1.p1 TRINITY_DN56559_c0_g1~~TRINITY_DN56559_c0_g1_i1.p1  ORF type:complete len:956 (-),score=413.39 TRINITY_DN56559_c0_g1_i1:87-2789(-)
MTRNKLDKEARGVIQEQDDDDEQGATKNLQLLQQGIVDAQLSSSVCGAIGAFLGQLRKKHGAEISLAVRSSGTMEDQAGSSYAGQYDTILNVPPTLDAVGDAVKRCWASMWQPHILEYRRRMASDASELPAMAVVVQLQLDPACSGVAFSMNPMNGDVLEAVVESVHGLGEGVVCGEFSPDTYKVDWSRGVVSDRSIVPQPFKFAFITTKAEQEEDGDESKSPQEYIGKVDTTKEERARSSLTETQAVQVADAVIRVAVFYSHPQDVEWAITRDGRLHLLQTRPITAFQTSSVAIGNWDNMGFQRTSALSNEKTCIAYTRMIANALAEKKRRDKNDDAGDDDDDGGESKTTENDPPYLRWYSVFYGSSYVAREIYHAYYQYDSERWAGRTYDEVMSAYRGVWKPVIDAFDDAFHRSFIDRDVTQITDDELVSLFRKLWRAQGDMDVASFTSGSATEFFENEVVHWVRNLNRGRAGSANVDKPNPRFSVFDLVRALHEPAHNDAQLARLSIDSIAAAVARSKAAYEYFSGTQKPQTAAVPDDTVSALIEKHCRRFFNFSDNDEDIACVPLYQDPSTVISVITNLVRSTSRDELAQRDKRSLADIEAEYAKERQRYESELTRACNMFPNSDESRNTLSKWFMDRIKPSRTHDVVSFRLAVESLRESLIAKERLHSMYTKSLTTLRTIIVERMRRIDGKNAILGLHSVDVTAASLHGNQQSRTVENVWHLRCKLLERLFEPIADEDVPELRRRVIANATVSKMFRAFVPLPEVTSASPMRTPSWHVPTQSSGKPRKFVEHFGLGSSPGTATGAARVIHSLSESHLVRKGDVLVTTFTNASWTPVFSLISGVVLEQGGMLSHAAVLCRELRIPCVSQVSRAKQRIVSGSMVTIDGNRGQVQVKQ